MLRSIIVFSAVLAVLAWLYAGRETTPAPRELSSEPPVTDAKLSTVSESVAERAPKESRRSLAVAAPLERAQLIGRVVDGAGAPIAGARARVSGESAAWGPGADVRVFDESGCKSYGIATTTKADGTFALDVPVPEGCVRLDIESTDDHELARRMFDPQLEQELCTGVRDVGTLTLLPAGSASGRVVDEHGEPVVGVRIGLAPYFSWYFQPVAITDPDGAWTLRHLAPGIHTLWAGREGWLWSESAYVEIAAGATTVNIEFVLTPAQPLRGTCVDEHGTPLAGVAVRGTQRTPTNMSAWFATKSGSDGTFALYPQIAGGCALDADDPERVWRNADRARVHSAGETGIQLTFDPLQRFEVLVVDGVTHAPIESFMATNYVFDGNQMLTRAGELCVHPGGIVEVACTAPTGGFGIRADGYVPSGGEAVAGVRGERRTVELVRGASLRGRVLDGETPVAGARVECSRVQLQADGLIDASDSTHFAPQDDLNAPDDPSRSMTAFETSVTTTGEDGTFAVSGLVDGRYALVIRPPSGVRFAARGYTVRNGSDVDAGDLRMERGGMLTGRVVVNEGTPFDHVQIDVSGWSRSPAWFSGLGTATVASDGTFRLAVPTGDMTVCASVRSDRGMSAVRSVAVRSDEATKVAFDLRSPEPCELRVRVQCDGAPLASAVVKYSTGGSTVATTVLGVVPSDGEIVARVAPGSAVKFAVESSAETRLETWDETHELPAGGRVEFGLDLRVAPLKIVFPTQLQLPQNGVVQLELETQCSTGPCVVATFSARIARGVVEASRGTTWSDDFTWDVGLVAQREYSVHARVLDNEAPTEQRIRPPSFLGEIALASCARARCELRAVEPGTRRFW